MMNLEDAARKAIMTLAKALAKAKGVKLSTVSRYVHSDARCLDLFAAGEASMSLRKFDEAMAKLQDQDNWPEGAVIPEVWEPWREREKR